MSTNILVTIEEIRSECDILYSDDPDNWSDDNGQSLAELRNVVSLSHYTLLTTGELPDTNEWVTVLSTFENATSSTTDSQNRLMIDTIISSMRNVINES